jgi:glutamine amidotransferase
MNLVAIVDYGMCNLDSVARAVEECGGRPLITDQAKDLATANHIILPGVGAFPQAMQNIRKRSLDRILSEQVFEHQISFLGICLGMQLLATRGLEIAETNGLGWIPGEVKRLDPFGDDVRIPHVGWNEVQVVHESSLFKGISSDRDFYFVHSYHLCPNDERDVLARTPYGRGFISAVQRGNIFGVQFHPEKSQRAGFHVLKNFLAI